jgi:hypothetical protein
MKKLLFIILLFISVRTVYSVQFVLNVENQTVSGNSVTFDLYIRTTAPADTIFLASSSWGWTFDIGNFTNTVFSVVEGYSTNMKSRTGIEVGELFYALTANVPYQNRLTGDISGPDPQTLTQFNQRVARISNQPNFHRIGRYKITGITNLNGNLNLNWYVPYCAIWGYETSSPYNTLQYTGTYTPIINIALPVENITVEIPTEFALHQNYPNPFNPVTRIIYDVAELSNVQIKIYNEIGQMVITLTDEIHTPGKYAVNFNGSRFASGIYFCKMITGKYTGESKMILIK